MLNAHFSKQLHERPALPLLDKYPYPDIKHTKFISVVRHPMTRTLSEYFWWNRCGKRNSVVWPTTICQNGINKDLEAWITHEENVMNPRIPSTVFFRNLIISYLLIMDLNLIIFF